MRFLSLQKTADAHRDGRIFIRFRGHTEGSGRGSREGTAGFFGSSPPGYRPKATASMDFSGRFQTGKARKRQNDKCHRLFAGGICTVLAAELGFEPRQYESES